VERGGVIVNTLKLGIVGAGFVARFHARALRQVRSVDIVGVTSRTRDSAAALAAWARDQGLGEAVAYPDVASMADRVDAVAICVPNFARVETAERIVEAVKRGAALKGVICEKPLARNVKGPQNSLL
jgi:predicted dehydrogenase